MELSQFLARTVSPGGHICVAVNKVPVGGPKQFLDRMFPERAYADAANYLRYASSQGWDAYHAQGSYKLAEQVKKKDGTLIFDARGKPIMSGKRSKENVASLRSFWIDMDVARPGDGKDAKTVYATAKDATTWLKQFVTATGLPMPNQMVCSGYGLHAYWLLEDPILEHLWTPYALAFKAAMLEHGFTGDSGITGDAARLLRPAGTLNMKTGVGVPVFAIDRVTRGEYPNQMILATLQKWVGQGVQAVAVGRVQTAGALAGGSVSPLFAGQALPNMNAAAANGIQQDTRARYFQRISIECQQAKQTLAARGNGDPYPLWYLSWIAALTFCADGDQYVHIIGDGDPRYTATETDAAWAQAQAERKNKGLGWPSCLHIERARPGGCNGCPHRGKINSPVALGVQDGDLPIGYRRNNGCIEHAAGKNEDGSWKWVEVIQGDFHTPVLEDLPNNPYHLQVIYERAGMTYPISVTSVQLSDDPGAIARMLNNQKTTVLRPKAVLTGDFLMAWINKLRDLRMARTEKIYPYGWAENQGVDIGFAYDSKLYRQDGRTDPVSGGDPQVSAMYHPQGDLAKWQSAAQFVIDGKPELQAVVCTAFGAPLMHYTGQKGLMVSVWSGPSAVGKSSALDVGRSVWGSRATRNTLGDTDNAAFAKIGHVRNLPSYWDEMRVDDENMRGTINKIFQLVEGREKARMGPDTKLRVSGSWETLVVAASNKSLMDIVAEETQGTDAGTLRLFEFQLRGPVMAQNARASIIVDTLTNHYGRAGEWYAQIIGRKADKVRGIVAIENDRVNNDLTPEIGERFYVAGVTAMMAGAQIAHHAGIIKFDLQGLRDYLYQTFRELRSYRNGNVIVSGRMLDHEIAFAKFMQQTISSRLITDRFGVNGQSVRTIHVNQNIKSISVQISLSDDAMRIDRSALYSWARDNNLSGRTLVEDMQKHWNALVGRFAIGTGTVYSSGAGHAIQIPMSHPAVQGYRWIDPNARPGKAVP